MNRDRADLKSIHRYSSKNRDLLSGSEFAACFYCLARFNPEEIQDWVDGEQVESGDLDDGVTALCPKCGIDAVLPSAAPINWDTTLLSEMQAYWFKRDKVKDG
jgi:hypothetical protein